MAQPKRTLSEVDAVSEILVAVGYTAVSAIQTKNAQDARFLLQSNWRKVLGEGWWFNKRRDFPLATQADDTIDIPDEVMDLDENVEGEESDNLIIVGKKLFKKNDNTNLFVGVDEIKVRVILALDFELCETPTAQDYAVTLATGRFARGKIADPRLLDTFRDDIAIARSELMRHHLNNSDFNLLANPALSMQRRHPRVGIHAR